MRLKQSDILCALACAAIAPASAAAQTPRAGSPANTGVQELEEVIVTAERRTADVQSTGTAVSVRSGTDLAAQGKYLLRQVLEDIPGVSALENNSTNTGSADVQGNNITIRGITPGNSAGAGNSQISATPATAVYVDGVYEGVGGGYDIERVEVLRGPQGTLYGRSATAGVVAFHTRNPTLDGFNAKGSVEFGNYDLQHYTAAANIPLTSNLAARISGDYRDQGEGYFGEASRGQRKRQNARAKLLWEPTDALSVLLGFAYEKDEAKSGGAETTANPALKTTTVTSSIFPGLKEQRQYWAEINWNLGPATLTYQGAYRTWEQNDYYLQTGNFISSGASLQQLIQTPVDQFQTHELRLASNDDSSLRWLAGLFYYNNKLNTSNRNFLVGANGSEIALQSLTRDQKNIKNLGFFAEATYAFTPAMRLTLGARYDDTSINVSEYSFENAYSLCGTALSFAVQLPSGVSCIGPGQASVAPPPGNSLNDVTVKFHNFNYKARIEYDLAPRNMVYASVSTGFRPGDAGISQNALNILNAEELTSVEFGSKNRFLQNTLQLNFAGYYYLYEGVQTSYNQETANPADYATPNSSRRVTVPARNIGIELEALYQPTEHDQIGVNYNYVQSRWVNKPAGFAQAQTETNRAITPHTITASYQHTFEIPGGSKVSARIDGKYESAHRTQNLHVDLLRIGYGKYAQVGDRTIGNAQLTWMSENDRYSFSAYVRNFTNEKYATYSVGGNLNALDVTYVDPRVVGVVLSASF